MSESPRSPASTTMYAPAPTLAQMNPVLLNEYLDWAIASSCPVCSSEGILPFAELRSIKHSRCSECGFVFVNPIPPDGVIGAFYNSPFYNNYRHLEQNRQQHDRYFTCSAYTDQRELARWLVATRPTSVLDFGCGTGNFLALLRDEFAVPIVEGLEVNSDSVQIARRNYGLELATAPDQLKQKYYDAAVLLEVIEHISNVKGIISQIAERVHVGGYLLLTTPAVDGFVARRLPAQCGHYTPPSHVSLFTDKSLRLLLASNGFEPIEVRVDAAPMPLRPALTSLFYDLDFASPAHDDDADDSWWRPTALGRRLGCPEGRTARLPLHLGGAARKAESILSKIVKPLRKPDHLYVLARRAG